MSDSHHDRELLATLRRIAVATDRIADALELANDRDPLAAVAAVMQHRAAVAQESPKPPEIPPPPQHRGSGRVVDGVTVPESFFS